MQKIQISPKVSAYVSQWGLCRLILVYTVRKCIKSLFHRALLILCCLYGGGNKNVVPCRSLIVITYASFIANGLDKNGLKIGHLAKYKKKTHFLSDSH